MILWAASELSEVSDWTLSILTSVLQRLKSEFANQIKGKDSSAFFKLLRNALTHSEKGPSLAEILYVLGRQESLHRLKKASS